MRGWVILLGLAWAQNANASGGDSGLAFWPVFNFLLLLSLLGWFLRKPIGGFLQLRHDGVKQDVEKAETFRVEVEELKRVYEEKLSCLDAEIEKILQEARAQGERERKKILERAERMAQKIREDAVLAAEKEKGRMIRRLERETLSGATAEAAKLLRAKVTEADHKIFVQELIDHLEAKHG